MLTCMNNLLTSNSSTHSASAVPEGVGFAIDKPGWELEPHVLHNRAARATHALRQHTLSKTSPFPAQEEQTPLHPVSNQHKCLREGCKFKQRGLLNFSCLSFRWLMVIPAHKAPVCV